MLNKQHLFESIAIFLLAVITAFVTNALRSDGLPLIRTKPAVDPVVTPNGWIVSLEMMQEKCDDPNVVILDARSSDEFEKGHIPGAKNLPYYDFLEKFTLILEGIPLDREIIAYCEGIDCSTAEDLSYLLLEHGYQNTKVFEGGWEQWINNGMPVEKKTEG